MVRFSEMSRGRFAGWMLGGLVFVVGSVTLAQQVGGVVSHIANGVVSHQKTYANTGTTAANGPDAPTDVSNAKFDYLVPGKSDAWKMNDGQTAYDPDKGIVKYEVTFTNAKVAATVTQQVFPDQLKPRGGDAFRAFVAKSNPSRSADVNGGTVYFLQFLQNGAPSSDGTNTVIFARDDVLMFGQARGMLGYDAWTKMMASLQKAAK